MADSTNIPAEADIEIKSVRHGRHEIRKAAAQVFEALAGKAGLSVEEQKDNLQKVIDASFIIGGIAMKTTILLNERDEEKWAEEKGDNLPKADGEGFEPKPDPSDALAVLLGLTVEDDA